MFETYILPILIFAALGIFAGALLTFASKFFEVKTDERLDSLSEALPQINCGSCGYSGCNEYAKAILNNNEKTNLCNPGGDEASRKIGEIMGTGFVDVVEQVAFIHCGGTCNVTARKYNYDGTQSCAAANRYYSGSKVCTNGCLGYGDCINVCPNDAIKVVDGIAVVDAQYCVGCGMCVKSCPNNLISLKSLNQTVDVLCSSTVMGRVTKSICSVGCIGCKLCQKACPSKAIKVDNYLATVNYDKCTQCGQCVSVCPVGAIRKIES